MKDSGTRKSALSRFFDQHCPESVHPASTAESLVKNFKESLQYSSSYEKSFIYYINQQVIKNKFQLFTHKVPAFYPQSSSFLPTKFQFHIAYYPAFYKQFLIVNREKLSCLRTVPRLVRQLCFQKSTKKELLFDRQ